MIPQSTIDEAIKRLVKVYNPLTIYLYGDYAWGTPNEESSYDLLIIIESSNERIIKRGYAGFEALWGLGIPQNIIVVTKEEFNQFADDQESTTYEIKTKGKIIYVRA